MLLDDIKRNKELSNIFNDDYYKIIIFSNVIINQIKNPLEIELKEKGINAQVDFAEYDNFVQESEKKQDYSAAIFFWEACNLSPGLHYKCYNWSQSEIDSLLNKVKSEISITLNNLKAIPIIIFNSFNSIFFSNSGMFETNFDKICNDLNQYIFSLNNRNIHILNSVKIISKLGFNNSFNQRMWYDAKMLYSYEYLREYSSQAANSMLSINGKQKKALILDCDNTLWKGIIGEDGIEELGYNSEKEDGIYFEEVHHYIKFLHNQGIILAINSKNNFTDVKNFFTEGKRTPLSWDDFIVKEVNWETKVANIQHFKFKIGTTLPNKNLTETITDNSSFGFFKQIN
jgi:predicted enzyme involved in methoxymalonyl-ACP biosynthesis